MSRRTERGFTIAEVVAVVLLGVGVMALVSSSAMSTRMIGGGKESTMAAQVGSARIETLRQLAASTTPTCTAAAFKTDSVTDAASQSRPSGWFQWGTARAVGVAHLSRCSPAVRDTMLTTIYCP